MFISLICWYTSKSSENFFQPFTVSGAKQSKSPRKNILCFEDLYTDHTSALQCYHLLFLCGIFRQVSSKGVCNLSDNFLWEKKKELLTCFYCQVNHSLFQECEAAAEEQWVFHTGRVQGWDAGTADPHAQGMMSVQRNLQDCEAESAQLSSEQCWCLCWVVIPHLALSQRRAGIPGRTHTQQHSSSVA